MNHEILEWVLSSSGPVIKYRTVSELLGSDDAGKIESLRRELLSNSMVQTWLNRLNPNTTPWGLHGSKSDQYENVMGKLYEFGLRKGIDCFDERTEPFRRWLAQQTKQQTTQTFHAFYCMLVAAFLAMTGYFYEENIHSFILERLETIFQFAKNPDFGSIYIPQDTYPGFPKAFRKKPLLNPSFSDYLPSIHDMNAFLHFTPILKDKQLRAKVETVVEFVLRPEYQSLYPGYGIIRNMKTAKYYSAGWSVHLPGYFESDVSHVYPYQFAPRPDNPTHPTLLLRLSMMSHSKTARKHAWFRRMVSFLGNFTIEKGLLAFPRALIPEKNIGYWINGHRLGLEAKRRTKKAIMCESTFRYFEITDQKIRP